MGRVYRSACAAAAQAGLDEDELQGIEGTGSDGAVTKADVEAYLEGRGDGEDGLPTKEDLIRKELAEGLSNDEIGVLVRETLGEDTPWSNGYVSWTVGNERRSHTDWWQAQGPRIVVERGVKPGDLSEEALKVARETYGEDAEDA